MNFIRFRPVGELLEIDSHQILRSCICTTSSVFGCFLNSICINVLYSLILHISYIKWKCVQQTRVLIRSEGRPIRSRNRALPKQVPLVQPAVFISPSHTRSQVNPAFRRSFGSPCRLYHLISLHRFVLSWCLSNLPTHHCLTIAFGTEGTLWR